MFYLAAIFTDFLVNFVDDIICSKLTQQFDMRVCKENIEDEFSGF